ncbi:hypothetical protein KY290_024963 [Solanum tuberosum]|uniref:Uncharacterized protein n=1 Tax=Solanum tuberosum TaxID=4113 RepID=A0ABQ7UTC6_SOLTU|nr:hypothetical protein KY290_024963 [Solanum tuberosum]
MKWNTGDSPSKWLIRRVNSQCDASVKWDGDLPEGGPYYYYCCYGRRSRWLWWWWRTYYGEKRLFHAYEHSGVLQELEKCKTCENSRGKRTF